jgi:hypothetical protein
MPYFQSEGNTDEICDFHNYLFISFEIRLLHYLPY